MQKNEQAEMHKAESLRKCVPQSQKSATIAVWCAVVGDEKVCEKDAKNKIFGFGADGGRC